MKAIILTLLLVITPFYCFAQQYQLSKPLMRIEGGNLFRKSTTVRMEFRLEGAHIHYTLDGTEPTIESKKYRRPLKVKSNNVIKARVFKEGFTPSETLESHVFKLGDPIQSIEISPQPPEAYAGDGSATLIDQQAGSTNFRDGKWLGYNKGPVVVILDLGKHKTVEEIIISSLSSPGSWIMNPSLIQSFFSHDGIHFQNGESIAPTPLTTSDKGGKTYYQLAGSENKSRYIKLVLQPIEQLPDWHPGKGNPGWLFIDEIIVR